MPMFDNKPIKFIGKHAYILQKYSKDKGSGQDVNFEVDNNLGEKKNIHIFVTRMDCYMAAGMLGILNNRTAEIDKDSNIATTATIFVDIINAKKADLIRMYRHMILSKNDDQFIEDKIKVIFSEDPFAVESENEQIQLENYVRGGLEILDEKFNDCKSYEDVCDTISDLLKELSPFL